MAGIALLVAFGRRGLLGQYLSVAGIELALTSTAGVSICHRAAGVDIAVWWRHDDLGALGEFGATIIFAGNFVGRTQTMPLAIYQGFEQELTMALTLSVILLAVSFAVLFIVKGALCQQL